MKRRRKKPILVVLSRCLNLTWATLIDQRIEQCEIHPYMDRLTEPSQNKKPVVNVVLLPGLTTANTKQ